MMSLAQQAAEASSGGMLDMFGGVAAADVQLRIPPYEPWPAADAAAAANTTRSASSCRAIRSTNTAIS